MTEEHEHYHGVDKAELHVSVDEARRILLENVVTTKSETGRVRESLGRVLSKDVLSPIDLPKRSRSTRDGYALNLVGDVATGQKFKVVGEVRIGTLPKISVKSGEALRVATGSYLPAGANTVVMVEYCDKVEDAVVVNKHVRIGENVMAQGEDFKRGETLLSRGSKIYPQHVALFSMLGVRRVYLFSKPRIAFFSTGDELVDVKVAKSGLTTIDANRPFIGSMISNLGGIPVDLGIARDNFAEIRKKISKGLRYDALVVSAGSSVGERDYVAKAAHSISGVKILIHGVAMRPSSPTGIAGYRGKPLLFLPGFPTSAIVSFFVFGVPAIMKLSGRASIEPPTIKARLSGEYEGRPGLTHFVRVKVTSENREYYATITKPTEAQYSSWLCEANGIAIIKDMGLVKNDETVDVFLIGEI